MNSDVCVLCKQQNQCHFGKLNTEIVQSAFGVWVSVSVSAVRNQSEGKMILFLFFFPHLLQTNTIASRSSDVLDHINNIFAQSLSALLLYALSTINCTCNTISQFDTMLRPPQPNRISHTVKRAIYYKIYRFHCIFSFLVLLYTLVHSCCG